MCASSRPAETAEPDAGETVEDRGEAGPETNKKRDGGTTPPPLFSLIPNSWLLLELAIGRIKTSKDNKVGAAATTPTENRTIEGNPDPAGSDNH